MRHLIPVLAALCVGCVWSGAPSRASSRPSADTTADVNVPLTAVVDTAPAVWRGISNIFLDSLTGPIRDSVRMPATWTDAALDNVLGGADLQPIRILRFRTAGDTALRFAIDTAGDLDFTRAPVLVFAPQGKLLVANIRLTARSRGGSKRQLPYQILRSEDRYTYARIAESRAGQLQLGDRRYTVQVRTAGHRHPFYAPNAGTVFLIDMDADGQMAELASLTVDGRPVAAEQVIPHTPFELDGRFYEIVGIDSVGSALRVRPSSRAVAVSPNRRAPEFRATTLTGAPVQLSGQRGKVVLISFWATDCSYSERVRPAANALVPKYGAKFTWMAMARDTSRADIAAYLKKNPIDGVVLLPDSATWRSYNPAGATPTFVLVDARGVVRFRAEGASAMGAVAAKLDELMAGSP